MEWGTEYEFEGENWSMPKRLSSRVIVSPLVLAVWTLAKRGTRRVRHSEARMRQVIEDWLNYTVVQNGQLRPEAVKLYAVDTPPIATVGGGKSSRRL